MNEYGCWMLHAACWMLPCLFPPSILYCITKPPPASLCWRQSPKRRQAPRFACFHGDLKMHKRFRIIQTLVDNAMAKPPRVLRCTAHVHAEVKRALAMLRREDERWKGVMLSCRFLHPRDVTYNGPMRGAIDREIFLRTRKSYKSEPAALLEPAA